MKSTRQQISLKKIEEEYEGDFLKDDDQMFKLKQIIENKNINILYKFYQV